MPTERTVPAADSGEDLLVRPAGEQDGAAVAEVHLRARRAAVAAGAMPPGVHGEQEVRAWLAARIAVDETWVAERDGEVVGYARFTPTWLDDLYVDPDHAGRGIGSTLLAVVQARLPAGFGLWVFACNTPARAFYARHGLVERAVSDGSGNEEGVADVELAWLPG